MGCLLICIKASLIKSNFLAQVIFVDSNKYLVMKLFYYLNPLYRTNSRFIATILVGGVTFDYFFNKYTRHYYYDVLNNGRTFKYLEPKIAAMNALKGADDDDDDDE